MGQAKIRAAQIKALKESNKADFMSVLVPQLGAAGWSSGYSPSNAVAEACRDIIRKEAKAHNLDLKKFASQHPNKGTFTYKDGVIDLVLALPYFDLV
jgi:hypothetical protein